MSDTMTFTHNAVVTPLRKAATYIPGGPKITEQSIFQDFVLSNSYTFSHCWIEHLFLVIITPRSLNLVENFLFYEYFLMDCHFRALPCMKFSLVGGPSKNNGTFDFLGLVALIKSYLFLPVWIEHLFLIIITSRSSNLVENFLFYE